MNTSDARPTASHPGRRWRSAPPAEQSWGLIDLSWSSRSQRWPALRNRHSKTATQRLSIEIQEGAKMTRAGAQARPMPATTGDGSLSTSHSWLTSMLIVSLLLHQHLHCLIHGEAARPLSRWKFLERLQVLAHDCLSRNQHKRMFYEPRIICTRLVFPTLERIRTHVEDLRGTQSNHRLHPDL